MSWYQMVFELIDMRSFSNLWYWIALAVLWSTTSHWVLGVPYDLVLQARRQGGQAEVDLEDLVRINVARLLRIGRVSGLWLLALACFLFSGLVILGFWYEVEFAQAVFLLLFPISIVGLMSLATAQRIHDEKATGDLLRKRLTRQRFWTQLLGMLSIFVTALWGMAQNIGLGLLHG